jgi:fibronectin type 3 domain-containing protein
VSSVTDGSGNIYTLAVGPTVQNGFASQSIYYAKNIAAAAAGANIVTVAFSSAVSTPDIRILEYSGADPTNPVDATAANMGTSSTSGSGSATTTNSTDLIFGANMLGNAAGPGHGSGRTFTTNPGSGFTSRMITSPDGDIAEDKMVTAAGSFSATASLGSWGPWIMQMVAFRTPSGGITAPAVSGVSPNSGSTAGGTAVTITGTNFATGATVTFGGTAASSVVVVSGTTIRATTPAGIAGAATVTVTSNGQSASLINGFTYTSVLSVTSVSPNSGSTAGGTAVTIAGANFATGATVTFGGTAATGVVVMSSGAIAATTPAGIAGAATVTVTSNGQSASLINGFTYTAVPTVSSVSPNSGSTAGGTAVTIAGTNFATGATVTFGGTAATGVVVMSSGSIAATTPGGIAGAATVTVTTAGQSASLTNGFTYTAVPTVTGVSPNSGSTTGGTAVTIAGTNFATGATVTFGGTAATGVVVMNSFTIAATTPPGIAGAATVTVTTNGRIGSLPNGFTYTAVPTVTGVSPNNGSTAGGTAVTIAGTNFATGATVTFGGTAATSVVVVSSVSITATTPAGTAGPVTVSVTNPGAQSGTLANGYTYSAATAITYVQGNAAIPQTAQASVTLPFTAAQAAGDLNVVAVGWNDSTATVNAITDQSGNSYIRAVGPTVQSGVASQSIYYAKNIVAAAAGGNVVTVTFSTVAKNPDIRILEYKGADPNNPVDVSAAASGSSALSSSGSVTTTNARDLLFGANLVQTETSGPGSGFTSRILTSPDEDIAEDEMVASIGSYSATAPVRSGQWIMQMVAFRTPSGVTTPPTAPANLTATAASVSQVNLSWAASTSNGVVANYIVQRCQGSGCTNFAQIAAPSATSYSDTGLLSNTSYNYRVQAVDTAGNLSTFSNTSTATTQAAQPPTAPGSLTAAANGASQIKLSWTASTSNVGLAHYTVQRCQGAGCTNFAQIATPSAANYTDTGLLSTTSYSYRVQASDTAGNTSGFSNTATATTQAGQQPAAPSNLSAAAASGSQIDLSWTASTSNVGVANYIVQRCQGAGCTNFAQIAKPAGTTYNDSGLLANTSYSYQVQASDTSGNTSPFSSPATATTGYVLPLKASSNNRYLVDQNGTPFLIMGDSPQALVGNLSPTDMATYMADRQRLGFNALWVNLLCGSYTFCNSNGTTYNGVAPFTSGSSPSNYVLSTPNSAYFSLVDNMLNLAATHNLVVFLDPIETGSWLATLENSGTTGAFNYGVYVGTRYKNFPNIIWLHGNDFQDWNSSSTDNNLVKQVMAGIASVDSKHLQTIELNYDSSYSNQDTLVSSLLNLDSAYSYFETYDIVLQSYNSSPTIPTYLVEANYEYENNTGALPSNTGAYVLREQAYWTMLSGGVGQIYGNHYTTSFASGWQSFLDGPGDLEIQYINQLFGTVAWWQLVPDQTHQVVIAGYGTYNGSNGNFTRATYCTTSWISGSWALTYCPNPSTLTVNLAEFSGPVTAQWYDPSNGAYTAISGSPFQNSGTHQFTTPGNNHDGNPDWVLVLHI